MFLTSGYVLINTLFETRDYCGTSYCTAHFCEEKMKETVQTSMRIIVQSLRTEMFLKKWDFSQNSEASRHSHPSEHSSTPRLKSKENGAEFEVAILLQSSEYTGSEKHFGVTNLELVLVQFQRLKLVEYKKRTDEERQCEMRERERGERERERGGGEREKEREIIMRKRDTEREREM